MNLLLASAAVLISAASFYATYLQSLAAQAQVRATALPYLEITHGNVDTDGTARITYHLRNVGVGPLILKEFRLYYDGERLKGYTDLLRTCCGIYGENGNDPSAAERTGRRLSNTASPRVIPAGDSVRLFSLDQSDGNGPTYNALDQARWRLTSEACFCFIMDECWTSRQGESRRTQSCTAREQRAYWRSAQPKA